ncbi:MAG: hypothetical protein HY704_03685 [Gemmatimonadetes bacterium]|nr:hypothetical protein [Gemmatimonadota bacterium]
MIVPNVRAMFGRREAWQAVALLAGGDPDLAQSAEDRLREEGLDALLDDPRLLNAILTDREVSVRPDLVFYVLVRHALLEGGIDDLRLADYIAALLLAFGRGRRANRVADSDEVEYEYLVDVATDLAGEKGRRAFLLRAHLGNYSLWLSGLFPQYIEARVEHRGAPPLEYYEEMGATGYRLAADTVFAEAFGLDRLYLDAAVRFPALRTALNRLSYRHFWPGTGLRRGGLPGRGSQRLDLG